MVEVDTDKLIPFTKALKDPIIHLENYGKILFSAYGDTPPDYIKEIILSSNNFDFSR